MNFSEDRSFHTFASNEVFLELQENFTRSIILDMTTLLNSDIDTASEMFGFMSAGHMFENICLWLVPLAERAIVIKDFISLTKRPKVFSFVVPKL